MNKVVNSFSGGESRMGVCALSREMGITGEAFICYGADGRH